MKIIEGAEMEIDVRKEAINLFNGTWDLIDMSVRTREQDAQMLHKAHASRYLWGLVGEAKNVATGEWQVSHVCALLGYGAPALLHAELCFNVTRENELAGIQLPFAYEALARAYAVLGENDKAREYKRKGLDAAAQLKKEDDRKYVESELNGIIC
jgi:hypothetical protein